MPTNADAALIPPARPTHDELSEPLGWLNYYCIDERTHQNVWSCSKIFIKLRLEPRFRLGVRVIAGVYVLTNDKQAASIRKDVRM